MDATTDREERGDQDKERDVVRDRRVQQLVKRGVAETQEERCGEGECPGGGDLAKMMMPEPRRQEREERNRQQDAPERERAPGREESSEVRRRAVHEGRVRRYAKPQRLRLRHRVAMSIPKRLAASPNVADFARTCCTYARSTSLSEPWESPTSARRLRRVISLRRRGGVVSVSSLPLRGVVHEPDPFISRPLPRAPRLPLPARRECILRRLAANGESERVRRVSDVQAG